ncbi:MAG: hypothetical protein ACFCU5_12600 [Pleurocapsa sp.]
MNRKFGLSQNAQKGIFKINFYLALVNCMVTQTKKRSFRVKGTVHTPFLPSKLN